MAADVAVIALMGIDEEEVVWQRWTGLKAQKGRWTETLPPTERG